MKEMMKAVVVNAPGDFGVYTVDKPTCPEGGMLVKVIACGLCGSDLRTLRSGHHRVKLPFTIGHEISGEVEQLGENYSGNWAVGDKLAISPLAYCGKCNFCMEGKYELCNNYKEIGQHWKGGLAEYIAIPKEAVQLGTIKKIPDGLDPVHATLVEPLSSVVNAQEAGNIGLGDVVVIIGAGPIGTFHVELARAKGAEKIVVADISDERLKLMEQYQPDFLINSKNEDLVKRVRAITDGYGADVVITANPAPEAQIQAVEMAKKGGRILLFGGLPKDKSTPLVDMNIVHYNALHLIGTTIFSPRHNRIALKLLAGGKISAEKFISHTMPLENFVEGAQLALAGKARKVVFKP
jgi:L-iditol 2-dehydrogenase